MQGYSIVEEVKSLTKNEETEVWVLPDEDDMLDDVVPIKKIVGGPSLNYAQIIAGGDPMLATEFVEQALVQFGKHPLCRFGMVIKDRKGHWLPVNRVFNDPDLNMIYLSSSYSGMVDYSICNFQDELQFQEDFEREQEERRREEEE